MRSNWNINISTHNINIYPSRLSNRNINTNTHNLYIKNYPWFNREPPGPPWLSSYSMSSHAVVLFGGPESGPQPLIRNLPPDLRVQTLGPGRIMYIGFRKIGQALESTANHLAHRAGYGPIAVTNKIVQQFGESPVTRQEKLDSLFSYATGRAPCAQDGLNIKQIKEGCRKLVQKYALPSVLLLYQFNFFSYSDVLDWLLDLRQSRHKLTLSNP